MAFDWIDAPDWAVAKGRNGSTAWIGANGYNFLPKKDIPEHPFSDDYPLKSFTIIEYRALPGITLREAVDPIMATPRIAAHEFLERGVSHMRDRAVQRDSEAGERSMARAVAAFNVQEGTNLTEAQGWRFMIQLKYARAVNGVFVADDYDDLCAYGGLAGEAASVEAK